MKQKILKVDNKSIRDNPYVYFDRSGNKVVRCDVFDAELIPENEAEVLAKYLGLVAVNPPERYGIFINVGKTTALDFAQLQLHHNTVKLIGGICFEFLATSAEDGTLPVYFDSYSKAEAFLEGLSSVYPKSFYKDAYVEQV